MRATRTAPQARDVVHAAEASLLAEVHLRLAQHYDLERWHWKESGTPPLDVCLGAILVQHTAWGNVEKALANLRTAGADRLDVLRSLSEAELAMLVRPAGTPLPKVRRIRALVELVEVHGGFDGLFARPVDELRSLLLATYGIGPETADVILLYAAREPAIVHDAYTARLMRRLGLGPENDAYRTWREWLDDRLPGDAAYRRAHHAGVVVHCKETCRSRPRCSMCPLLELCAFGRETTATSPGARTSAVGR